MATIKVTGRAQVFVPPDEATVALSVEAVAPLPTEALEEVATRARELIALLDELGIPAAKRVTSGIAVAEAGEHDAQGRWQHRGYRASERLTVAVSEPETIGELLGEAVARAQARVQGPWWAVALDNPARDQVLQAAAEDARRRAEALARGLDVRVGALVDALEVEWFPTTYARGALEFAPAGAPPPVEAGESAISAAVTVSFQVERT
jgi:uncharacterized protein YggE